MNDLAVWSLGSIIWGFLLFVSGGIIKELLELRTKSSGIGFLIQIIGCIFIICPFVISAICISIYIITGLAGAISTLI